MPEDYMEKPTTYPSRNKLLEGPYLVFLSLFFLIAGIIFGTRYQTGGDRGREVDRFEQTLHEKERFLQREFERLDAQFREESPTAVLDTKSAGYQDLAMENGISIFYYKEGMLTYWSDHSIPVPERWRTRYSRPYVSLRNADYVSVVRQLEEGRLLGLIEIRTHYPIQNQFLVSGFHPDFRIREGVEIRTLMGTETREVQNAAGEYLFSLDFSGARQASSVLKAGAVFSLLLFVIFAFAGFCLIIRNSSGMRKWIWMGWVTLLIAGIAILVLKFRFPAVLTNSDLFQPELFASTLFPSLGDLLILTLTVLSVVALYHLYGGVESIRHRSVRLVLAILFFFIAAGALLLTEYLIRVLVLDSSISFEAFRVTSFTGYTVVGLLILIAWFVVVGLFLEKAIVLMSASLLRTALTGTITSGLVWILASVFQTGLASTIGWLAFLLIFGGVLYLRFPSSQRISFSRYIFLLVFVSIFMVIRLQEYNRISVEQKKEVELVKLSSEHDPVAEMLFSELSMAIRNDTVFAHFMNQPFVDIEQVVNRLRRNYFSGYWTKYDLQVAVCRPEDRIYVQPPDDEWHHCYTFFSEMIEREGIEIPGSDFYFLDNLNGRISYMAAIPYFQADSEHKVYIELDSKILSRELGYPELLLDEEYSAFTSSEFSYAKYNRGELITHDGDFPYRRSVSSYTGGEEMFERVSSDGYHHVVFNVDDQNTIIVGSPGITMVDNLISFSYIFAVNFLLMGLFYLGSHLRSIRPVLSWSFKHRIQYSMIGILFLTFVLICSGTIYFIIEQYRMKNNDNLRNIMRSVNIELIHKLEFEENLRNWSSPDYYNLDELLRKFSNVFYTDINLYDEEGDLLATSRPEIFDRQLLSRRMNRMVYEQLALEDASEIIHNEHIGGMKYISAYTPLLNSENELLAYLNLPYFTQSGALTRDVTNLVVAVINIYLILLLVILLLSVILADRITQPLRMIQNKIAQVSLSKKNEMIQYERRDEIRGLVEEYNYMVKELERSAGLLAQSERESAWREMAKQIAHEIKNPLTPMKLNVQHLQRMYEEGRSDRDMIDRISATLIEQIDSLSAIANEFSDFAKMPKARHQRLNLVTKLRNLLQLFGNSEKARIHLDLDDHKMVVVKADKEQLMRVFINLVKNGMQAIPEGREGHIWIRLEVKEPESVLVTIRDNGKGIPEEIKDRLFRPNFTTKSAGMGMGLAISYNVVRSLGGRIWYETEIGKGTVFHVELPLAN